MLRYKVTVFWSSGVNYGFRTLEIEAFNFGGAEDMAMEACDLNIPQEPVDQDWRVVSITIA